MKKIQLSQDAVSPVNQWDNQFFFPNDRVANAFYKLFDSADTDAPPFRDFEIVGERVMTNVTTLWIDYVHNALESLWPEDFAEFMEVAFAARIAVTVKGEGSRDRKNDLDIEAYGDPSRPGIRGLWQDVKTRNAIGSPVTTYGDDTLSAARFGGLFPQVTGGERFQF